MFPSPLVVGHHSQESYRLSWDFDLRGLLTHPAMHAQQPVSVIKLPGSWSVSVGHDGGARWVGLTYGFMPPGYIATSADRVYRLSWLDNGGRPHRVATTTVTGPFPMPSSQPGMSFPGEGVRVWDSDWRAAQDRANGAYDPLRHDRYRLSVVFRRSYPKKPVSTDGQKEQLSKELAQRMSGVNFEQLPHKLRLFFPRVYKDGAELWANAELLTRASSHFEDLLKSGFAESSPRLGKRARKNRSPSVEIVAPKQEDKSFEDSDDETDDFLFSKKPPSHSQSSEADDISFRQIDTGFISFTPLTSSFVPSQSSSNPREDFLSRAYDKNPSLPLPVSPKSAYRLAHYLDLEDLQNLSLNALHSFLSPECAAQELFDDASLTHPAISDVIVEYVKANWAAVKASEGWEKVSKQVEDDAIPGAAPVVLQLARAGLQV
ncbi:hypothetical protein JCM10213_006515 [Rhodosporidiobolus nylandii]